MKHSKSVAAVQHSRLCADASSLPSRDKKKGGVSALLSRNFGLKGRHIPVFRAVVPERI